MLEKSSGPDDQLSKEDYLIMKAKEALSVDTYAAKSWLITARSFFPNSAKIQVQYCYIYYCIYINVIILSNEMI